MLGTDEVERLLTFLVVERNVDATTQAIALNARVFFCDKVLGKPLGELGAFGRSSRQRKLPVVLNRDEVRKLLAAEPIT